MRHFNFSQIAAALGLLVILAGCATIVPPAALLPNNAAASAPAVAVEANATRHVVWQDCGSTCSIVYHRTTGAGAAAKIQLDPPAGESYREPDIAVTDDGRAFIVWRSFVASANAYLPYFAVIPAGGTAPPARQALAAASNAGPGIDPPSVAARGNTVFAVYFKPTATTIDLYKRGLNPFDPAGVQVTANPNSKISNASLAIDSAGGLHIAYEYGAAVGGQYQGVFYHGPTAGQRLIANNAAPGDYYSKPDLELDSADNAYVAYSFNKNLDVFRRRPSGEETSFSVVSPAVDSWFPWNPDMAVVAGNLQIVFVSGHNSIPYKYSAVWKAVLNPNTSAVTGPARISDVSVYLPTAPRVVDIQNTPVVMWTQVDPGSGHCAYEGFNWVNGSGAKKVFSSTGCFQDELDVAFKGEWIAAVAISGSQADFHQPAPWIAYNTK